MLGVGVGGAKVPSLGEMLEWNQWNEHQIHSINMNLYLRSWSHQPVFLSQGCLKWNENPTRWVSFLFGFPILESQNPDWNHGQPTPQQKRTFITEGNRLPIENVQTSVPPFSLLHFQRNTPLLNSKNLAVIHGCPPSVGGRKLWNSITPVVWKSGIPKGKQCSIRKSLDSKRWKMNPWGFLNFVPRSGESRLTW